MVDRQLVPQSLVETAYPARWLPPPKVQFLAAQPLWRRPFSFDSCCTEALTPRQSMSFQESDEKIGEQS